MSKGNKKHRKGIWDRRIDFPPIKEWRPPYWKEMALAAAMTYVLGIASTVTYEEWLRPATAATQPGPPMESGVFVPSGCPRTIEAGAGSARRASLQ